MHGKITVIVFKDGMRNMLHDALKARDFSGNAQSLSHTADIIRQDLFNHDAEKFSGSLSSGCQENSISSSVKILISMILNGTSLKDQDKTLTPA